MSLRCYISDIDIQGICADVGDSLWDEKPIWPPDKLGLDGVISDVNADGTEAKFTSASGNFQHITGGDANEHVPVGTTLNMLGRSFVEITAVDSNVTLSIKANPDKPSMFHKIVAGSGVKYLIGGYSEQIQSAYEEVWTMCGMVRAGLPDPNPLCFETQANLVDQALYIPDGWHGADKLISWCAIKLILYSAYRNNDSSYKDKYDEAVTEYERYSSLISFTYDFDEDGEPDAVVNVGQIGLSR